MGRNPSADESSQEELAALGLDAGRNRVFYRREAGLVTPWYIAQRCEEECYRAERYERPFRLLVIEPATKSSQAAAKERAVNVLQEEVRRSDVASYLGNARFAILLPETTHAEAALLLARLQSRLQFARSAVTEFPEDGRNFTELLLTAFGILHDEESAA